jgi:hypothetical protein
LARWVQVGRGFSALVGRVSWVDDQDVDYGPEFNPTAAIAQAQGMVSVQAECTLPEALALMRDRAIVTHQTLDEVAVAVIDRAIRFGA